MSRDLPDGWRWARLGDVCDIVNGSTPKTTVSDYWEGDICWVTPTDLSALDSSYIAGSARTLTEEGYESCSTKLVPAGSVILSSRAPIGHLGIATESLCTNQGCKALVPRDNIETRFLYYALRRSVDDLRAIGTGATFAEVNKRTLAEFAIAVAPLTEQQRITEMMATVERLQLSAAGQLLAVDALATALLGEIFPRSPAAR